MANDEERNPDDIARRRALTGDEPSAGEAELGGPSHNAAGAPGPGDGLGRGGRAATGASESPSTGDRPTAHQGGGSYGQRDFGPGAQRSHFQQDQGSTRTQTHGEMATPAPGGVKGGGPAKVDDVES